MKATPDEFERLERQFGWKASDHLECKDKIWFTTSQERYISFPEESYDACWELELESFWFAHRNRVIWSTIKRFNLTGPIWDIGAGNGAVSDFLKLKNFPSVAVEPSNKGANHCAQRGLEPTVCGYLEEMRLPTGGISSIGSFDVVEHLSNPLEFLVECRRLLAPGNSFVVTVPAFQWLWSQTDSYAGHFCRYDRESLRNLFLEAGFKERYSTYFFSPLVLPLWVMRVLKGRLVKSSSDDISQRSVNHLKGCDSVYLVKSLRYILSLEAAWLDHFSLPTGTSLLGVFESV